MWHILCLKDFSVLHDLEKSMGSILRRFSFVMLLSCPCWADADHVQKLLLSALANPSPEADAGLNAELTNATYDLKSDDFKALLPLAAECLKSQNPTPRNAGVALFFAASHASGGTTLLDPYVQLLGDCLRDPECPYKTAAVTTLAMANPQPSESAAAVLLAQLDEGESPLDYANIVGSLIRNFPSDAAMRHKVLRFVEAKSLPNVTLAALNGLHVMKDFDEDSIQFIRACLGDRDQFTRASALDLLKDSSMGVRSQFADRIKELASDPEEPRDVQVRAQALQEP
jgi:hypothetical protein